MSFTEPKELPRLDSSSPRRAMWAVFLCALLARLAMCWWGAGRVPPTADGSFYHVVAQRIAAGQGYTWLWPDGAVTYAAHYPVGYPAMVGVAYRALGVQPAWAMVENALLGALGTAAACHLAWHLMRQVRGGQGVTRSVVWAWRIVAVLLIGSPTLLLYTPALMTESCVGAVMSAATLLVFWSKERGNSRGLWLLAAAGALLAWACLLRPQSVLMAPVLGLLSAVALRRRLVHGLLLTALTVGLVTPWTLRNCERLERCVFVSANGGWNLLIGTFAEGHGGWVAVDGERVPVECREVFSEAGKDACFAEAGRRRIAAAPRDWVRLIPHKLRNTLDFAAAGTEHLAASGAVSSELKPRLQSMEYLWQRGLLALGLLGAWAGWTRLSPAWSAPTRIFRNVLLAASACTIPSSWSWIAWCALALLVLLDSSLRTHVASGACLGVLASTLLIHSVFFGAGRYSIPLWYAMAPLVGVGLVSIIEVVARPRRMGAEVEQWKKPGVT